MSLDPRGRREAVNAKLMARYMSGQIDFWTFKDAWQVTDYTYDRRANAYRAQGLANDVLPIDDVVPIEVVGAATIGYGIKPSDIPGTVTLSK